jgi:hypothetical protein
MTFDLDQKLNDLIIKYDIDKCNDRYRKYLHAESLLKQLMDEIKHHNIVLISDNTTDIVMTADIIERQDIKDYVIKNYDEHWTNDIHNFGESLFIIVNLDRVQMIKDEWNKSLAQFPVIYLYEYFDEHGLKIDYLYYDIIDAQKVRFSEGSHVTDYLKTDFYSAVYHEKCLYKNAFDHVSRKRHLERIIFDYIYIKDFVSAKQYIDLYIANAFDESNTYRQFLSELETLISTARSIIENKQGNHIIWWWLDALDYGSEQEMPYLKKVSSNSAYFENAFTNTPFTSSVMNLILCKKMTVDDDGYKLKMITNENGELIKLINENGYEFQYYGHHTYNVDKSLYFKTYPKWLPSSCKMWDVIANMLRDEQNKVYLIHCIPETHSPYLSGLIEKNYNNLESVADTHILGQKALGKKYLDMQIEFYSNIAGDKHTALFMSDHGSFYPADSFTWKYHIVLFLCGKNVEPKRYRRVFEYYNFDKLFHSAVFNGHVPDSLFSEYAAIQDTDYRADDVVRTLLNPIQMSPHFLFGYKGIITEKELYIKYNNGEELYYIYPSRINRIGYDRHQARIDHLKSLIMDKNIDVFHDDMFRWARNTYVVMENYYKRVGREPIGCKLMKEKLENISDDKIIAVRGGGEHTIELLGHIGPYAEKIKYIIDQSLDNRQHFLGFTMIHPDEIEKYGIDVIIISSIKHRSTWKEEIANLNKKYEIIDIYNELEARGIDHGNRGFYENVFIESDFEGLDFE